MHTTRRRGVGSTAVLVLSCLVVLLAGCRLGIEAQVSVDADGSGTAAVVVTLAADLIAQLDAAEIDPTAEFEAAVAATDGWTLQRESTDEGGIEVRLHHEVEDAAALGDAFRSLSSGLDDEDPALLVDLAVTDQSGAVTVEGAAAVRGPQVPAATRDGEAVGPDVDELAQRYRDAVTARLVVALPGAIERHDGDRVEGGRVTYELTDTPRSVEVVAREPSWWAEIPLRLVVAAGGGLLLVVVIAAGVVSRRRRTATPSA